MLWFTDVKETMQVRAAVAVERSIQQMLTSNKQDTKWIRECTERTYTALDCFNAKLKQMLVLA